MSLRVIFLVLFIFAISLTGLTIWQMMAEKVPEPKYKVVSTDGNIEIRDYPQVLVAEVQVKGERYRAINQGFRILADYIFGNNKQHAKMGMSAPVTQQNDQIAMNAPVMQTQQGEMWAVRFVMPENYNRETIPMPVNPAVKIIELPALKYVVIKFSGWNTDSNIEQHKQMLLEFVKKNHLTVTGEPVLAFYNPPWILPFLRRNELLFELKND